MASIKQLIGGMTFSSFLLTEAMDRSPVSVGKLLSQFNDESGRFQGKRDLPNGQKQKETGVSMFGSDNKLVAELQREFGKFDELSPQEEEYVRNELAYEFQRLEREGETARAREGAIATDAEAELADSNASKFGRGNKLRDAGVTAMKDTDMASARQEVSDMAANPDSKKYDSLRLNPFNDRDAGTQQADLASARSKVNMRSKAETADVHDAGMAILQDAADHSHEGDIMALSGKSKTSHGSTVRQALIAAKLTSKNGAYSLFNRIKKKMA